MRLASYLTNDGPCLVGVRDGAAIDLTAADPSLPRSMKELLALGAEGLDRVRAAMAKGKPLTASGARLRAPVPDPQKVICIGLNYADHAAESGTTPPPEPVVFNKFPSAVCAGGDKIALPSVAKEVDYEAELVVVIGTGGRDIPKEKALSHVAGYACGHDVSARDWQIRKPGGQWLLGKSFDSFAPFGPHLVTADEVGDPGVLDIALRLNGEIMQKSNTGQLIFPVDHLIAYVSQVCTLSPGDVLFTGTPGGVGMGRKPPVFLKPGDVVEVEIERLGVLRNEVAAA